jgi:L-aminopeptidase/D-esterase-like protein
MTLRNIITDIPGLRVGHAGDVKLGSGTTVVIFDAAVVASVDVRGGGPGTRETALLDPAQTVEGIDAIVLSGGSAFGLDAARDPVRFALGRRQELGPLSALSRARL